MTKRFIKRRQHGSSMIEVLVTMVIIAIGLLGQAALTVQSSKASNAAFMRTQATLLASDIIERLRLNRQLAVEGEFSIGFAALGADPSDNVSAGTTIEKVELRDWKTNIEQALTSGDGKILVEGGGNVTIEIRWCEIAKGNPCETEEQLTSFTTQSVI